MTTTKLPVKETRNMKKFIAMGLVVAIATAVINVKKIEFKWENPLLNK